MVADAATIHGHAMTPSRRATLPILPIVAAALLMGLGATIQAEEIDVLTLKNGKVLEGHYNPATKAFFFGGGITGRGEGRPGGIGKAAKGPRPGPGGAPRGGAGSGAAPAGDDGSGNAGRHHRPRRRSGGSGHR